MKFVICSSPRTGSHALASALNEHSDLNVAGEVFFRPNEFNVYGNTIKYALENIFSKYDGFILHRSSNVNISFPIEKIWSEIFRIKDLKVINLKRLNIFEAVISLLHAMKNDLWQIKNKDSSVLVGYDSLIQPLKKIHIDPNQLFFYLRRYSEEYQQFDDLLNRNMVKFINLSYEELCQNWEEQTIKVQKFLELIPEKIDPATNKQIGGLDYVENYGELKELLKESEWNSCFQKEATITAMQPLPLIENENRIINGLWIGKKLGKLEELTIKSFQDFGHEFHLWLYDDLDVPAGCVRRNANEIIPKEEVFEYVSDTLINKSVAGFSDIFRFALLYKIGGWYVDMDVTCVKSFDFSEDIILRKNNWIGTPVANIVKLPKGSEFAYDVWQTTKKLITSENTDFILPMSILAVKIAEYSLQKHIVSPELFINCLTTAKLSPTQVFSSMDKQERQNYYNNNLNFRLSLINTTAYAVHWSNQYHQWNKIDTCNVLENTIYKNFLTKHGISLE